jgi:cbb3-type cytochrome oxidase subunit 3
MHEMATANIVIGVLASLGVVVLIIVFAYVLWEIFQKKD